MLLLLLGYTLSICLITVPILEANGQASEQRTSSSNSSCITPSAKSGSCIPLPQCQSLIQVRNVRLVRKSRCGFQGKVLKVCCENTDDTDTRTSSFSHISSTLPPKTFVTLRSSSESGNVEVTSLSTTDSQPEFGHSSSFEARFNPDDSCSTVHETHSSCIPLLHCRNMLQARNMNIGKTSICGFEGKSPKVCCANIADDDLSFFAETNAPLQISAASSSSSGNSNGTTKSGRRRKQSSFSSGCGTSKVTFTRIVGGQESRIGAWPWMAVIYYFRKNAKSAECGGVLVSKKHIITAAHCVVSSSRGTTLNPRQLSVRLGDHDIESDDDGVTPIDLSVASIIKHEDFDLRTFQNDIAILSLASTVRLGDSIFPICLPFNGFNEDTLQGRNAFVAGWGSIRYGGPSSSKLLEVQLRIWNNDACKEVFQAEVPISDVNLCAGDGDKDACRGDSGGPLMLTQNDGKFYLAGIVSFGKKCAVPGVPGVYTRVTKFVDWIQRNIDNEV